MHTFIILSLRSPAIIRQNSSLFIDDASIKIIKHDSNQSARSLLTLQDPEI